MPRPVAHCRSLSYLKACRILLPATLTTLGFSRLAIATHTWNDGTGVWSLPSNWNPASLPGLNENVFLNSNDGVARTITYDSNVTNVQLAVLNIDLTGAGSNFETLAITSGTLTTTTQDVGVIGRGAITQSGGSNNAAAIILGDQAGSIGNYTMTFGALNVSGDELIGKSGTGTLTMSGNSGDTITGNLSIGAAAGGNGTISLSGSATVNAANIFIGGSNTGAAGKGVVNLTGGSLVSCGTLTIYNTAGSLLNLSGGIVNVNSIQLSNPASFQFNGGSIRVVNQPIDIATSTVADSALLLQNNITLNNFQILNSVNWWVWLRSGGSSLTQNPGSNVFAPYLYVGNQTGAGANAVYTVNGGNLNISQTELIGYVGTGGVSGGGATFNQYAGNNTAPVMLLGNNGPATYNQFDGNVTLNTNLQIAPNSSLATYNISGGVFTSPAVYVGGNTSSSGTAGTLNISGSANMTVSGTLTIYNSLGTSLNLSGGSLTAGNINFSGNKSLFHWTGGSLHLTNLPLPFTNSGDPNALFGNSLSLGVGQSLIVDQGESLNTAGSNITQSGGLNAPLFMIISTDSGAGPTASYTMTGGNLDVHFGIIDVSFNNPGILTISGGSAIAHQLITNNGGTFNLSGTAIFTAVVNELLVGNSSTINQTGGTNNIGSALEFGSTLPSTYNFSGGAITGTGYISIGGTDVGDYGLGVFNMSGAASITIPNALVIRSSNGNLFNFNGGNITVGALNFNGNPANFVWTAGTLNINSSVTWDPNAGPTSTGSALGSSLTLGAGKTLAVTGDETLGGNGAFFLTVNSGGNHTVSGNLSLTGNGLLTLNTGGAVTASGLNFNATPGNFIWNGGTLTLNTDVAWDSSALPTTTGGTFGAALTLGANKALAITGNETIGGTGPFTLTLNSGSTHSVTGNITLNPTGSLVSNGGQLSYNTFSQNGGAISGPANNTFINSSTFIYNSGSFSGQFINSKTAYINSAGFFSPTNGIENDGLMVVSSTSTVYISNGFLFNNGIVQLNGGAVEFNTGNLYNAVGTFTGYGNILAFNGLNSFAHIIQSNGNLSISTSGLAFTNAYSGVIDIAPNQILNIFTFNATNNGLINLNGGSLAAYGMLNSATAVIAGNGTIYGNNNFINAGLLEVDAGMLLIFGNAITNSGTIQLGGVSAILNGAVTNNGTIQGLGRVTGAVTSNGTIEAIGGTLSFANSLASTGTLRTAPATKLLLQNFPTNAGLIDLAGGTFDTAGQPLNNTGQISGFGVLSTGGLTNNGTLTLTAGAATVNGPLINAAGKTILVKNTPALFTGNVTNNGTIKITSTTVTFTGNYTGNQYISDPATNIFQQSATVIPGGLMSGGPGDVFIFNTFTNNGTFTNGGNLTVSTSVTNSGNLTQSGPQLWLPNATFTNTAGTATFQSNAKLYGLAITGGTVDLTSSKFIVESSPANKPATLTALQQNLASHALTSSTVPPNFGLALIDNAALNLPNFGNGPADANSLLLGPELLGDANIDGKVDLTDLSTILNHFGLATPLWNLGNFDHAATINLTDLSAVLNNFGQTNPNPTSSAFSLQPSAFSNVPEPTTLTLLLPATLLLHKRRRRI